MANVWFSADFHFGHSNIIRYCDRPFDSAAEMDEAILDRVNESVKADDELYFLGDFCIGGQKVAAAYRQKIRCKKETNWSTIFLMTRSWLPRMG